MKSEKVGFFILCIGIVCVIFFQNCALNTNLENNNEQEQESESTDENEEFSPFADISCQINNITMDKDSIEFQVNDFEESIEVEWGDAFDDVDDADLQEILDHFYLCAFVGDQDSKSKINRFKIQQDDEDVASASFTEKGIFLSVNKATEDDGLLRLLSFTSVKKTNEFSTCDLLKGKLHKVTLDDDDNVILSTDPRLECEDVQFVEDEDDGDEYTLSCTYTADQPGCIFRIALWSYDSKYRIASQRHFIQLQME